MSSESTNNDPAVAKGTLEEQLVAYLDGELDDENARQVEVLLAANPRIREVLGRLERTWEALDQLGRAEVDETFAQTTLEMVAVAAEDDAKQQEEETPRKNRRRWLIGAGVVLIGGVAGFLATTGFRSDPNERLLRDLPVLENLDQYQRIDNVKFLERLYEEDLFAEAEHEA